MLNFHLLCSQKQKRLCFKLYFLLRNGVELQGDTLINLLREKQTWFLQLNFLRKEQQPKEQKRAHTTFFLLTGKLPLDLTIMVHNLTSSG